MQSKAVFTNKIYVVVYIFSFYERLCYVDGGFI